MYVCICRAVTERQIAAAVENGARSLKDLRRDLGVTQACSACASCAHRCLQAMGYACPSPCSQQGEGAPKTCGFQG